MFEVVAALISSAAEDVILKITRASRVLRYAELRYMSILSVKTASVYDVIRVIDDERRDEASVVYDEPLVDEDFR